MLQMNSFLCHCDILSYALRELEAVQQKVVKGNKK